ncbi:hypothetical protein ACKGJI_08365 [Sulfurospirillum sp. 1307]|jgi:hypothetical protein
MKSLTCSKSECKRMLVKSKKMDFKELEKFAIKCSNCGDWIFKEEKFANITYNEIASRYAQEFMRKMRYFS